MKNENENNADRDGWRARTILKSSTRTTTCDAFVLRPMTDDVQYVRRFDVERAHLRIISRATCVFGRDQ